jgi:hypothetical protein
MVDKAAVLKVKSFESLVEFLVDELGWQIEIDKFDNLDLLGYDFTPEELGLKEEHAAQIREIKQLRPIADEPWGIFWIDFEPRKLHITALRRVLSKFVTKKRANHSDRATWDTEDLLFITAQGEDEQRGITFAHFHRDSDNKEVIRDFSWDQAETHFHYIAGEYLESLRWPEPGIASDKWRENWLGAFTGSTRKAIRTSKELAEVMATLARDMRMRVEDVFEVEKDDGPLHLLFDSFKKVLIHDLDVSSFADMYAQTVTYGLFSARCMDTDGHFELGEVVERIPETNPFLKDLFNACFKTGEGDSGSIDLDELGVKRLVELLDSLNEEDGIDQMQRILQEFGRQTRGEDPVIHFYEGFLDAYEQEQRKRRGVYYTPDDVVSFIVRSVDEILREEFGLKLGLADTTTWGELVKLGKLERPDGMHHSSEEWKNLAPQPFVQILDPATGTGTFLKHTIELIQQTMIDVWQQEGRSSDQQVIDWNSYVSKDLLPRLNGFELMMAPYAVCHMKLGLVLQNSGYGFQDGQRLNVFLTNTLEEPHTYSGLPLFSAFLAQESERSNNVKENVPITVVLGNPPYANYSSNLTPYARSLVGKYRTFGGTPIRERNQLQFERNLQDDFVKFVSIGENEIIKCGAGVFGYITNATMLASRSLRGMRENLFNEFSSLHEFHLHGGTNEIADEAQNDQNVFEISQAVAIHLYTRSHGNSQHQVHYSELWGPRKEKYAFLKSNSIHKIEWERVTPDQEIFSFVPQKDTGANTMMRISDVFEKFGAGIKTNRDAIAIAFQKDELVEKIRLYSPDIVAINSAEDYIQPILYRPFDERVIFYDKDIVASRSLPTMKHVLAGKNIGLVASSTWTTPDRFSVNVSNKMIEMKTGTHDRGSSYFPLYRYESVLGGAVSKVHNLTPEFIKKWDSLTSLFISSEESNKRTPTVKPEDIFFWIYAICHSFSYRFNYRSILAQGFPVLIFPKHPELFEALTQLGSELIECHLMEPPNLNRFDTTFTGPNNPEVSKIGWSEGTVWIDAARTNAREGNRAIEPGSIGIQGVPEKVWDYHVGGYQVCHKWLKGRKGRTLSENDISHYQNIIASINETIRISGEIDKTIEEHGGWSDAFVSEQ